MLKQSITILLFISIVITSQFAFAQSVSISADGSKPNSNAILDVKSPANKDGKGMLIPRITAAQRTTANANLAGGLLDDNGYLRGGEVAQGLIVYQTDETEGLYYNTSTTETPNWVYLGPGNGTVTSITVGDGLDGGTITTTGTISLSDTGTPGTYTKVTTDSKGRVSSGVEKITNSDIQGEGTTGQFLQTDGAGTSTWSTVTLPITGTNVAVGNSANAASNGVAVGVSSNGRNYAVSIGANSLAYNYGVAVGYQSNARQYGVSLGRRSNGYDCNVAVGYCANGFVGYGPYSGGVAIGYRANAFSGDGKYTGGVAIGYTANARHNFNENDSGAVAIGCKANAFIRGVGIGWQAAGYNQGVALGYNSTGSNSGVGVGYKANGYRYGTAIGYMANAGNKKYSFAKGAYSKCNRYNEEWKTSDGYNNKYGYGQVNFHGTTTSGAPPREIYLGGSSNQRFILNDNSAVTFNILVTGRNKDSDDSSGWRICGVIKRNSGANTTALIGGGVTIDAVRTQGGLNTNPTISADTTNGALKVEVTGVAGNTVIWNAAMSYSEVRE